MSTQACLRDGGPTSSRSDTELLIVSLFVPTAPVFRKGVEAWNEAFTLIERPQAVRAMLPEDEASSFRKVIVDSRKNWIRKSVRPVRW